MNQENQQTPPKKEIKNFLNKKNDLNDKKPVGPPPSIKQLIKWLFDKKRLPYTISFIIWLLVSTIVLNVAIAILYWKVYAWIVGSFIGLIILSIIMKLLLLLKSKVKATLYFSKQKIKAIINYLGEKRENFYKLFTK